MGFVPVSLESIFGAIFAPVAWLLGVPWQDAGTVGGLLGTRLITNEAVAFTQLGQIKDQLHGTPLRSLHMRFAGLRI